MPTTLASNALTDLERVKGLLGRRTANESNRDEILWLINVASDIIEKFCRRHFKLRRYGAELNRTDAAFSLLKHYPVTDVESVHSGVQRLSFLGTADGGSKTTLVDAALTQADDYWKDADGGITVGGLRYARTVESFDAATDTLTWSTPLPAAVTAGDAFRLMLWDTSASSTLQVDDYWIGDASIGRIEYSANFGLVLVKYWAGYESVPDDLNFACASLVAALLQESRRHGLASFSSGFGINENYQVQTGSKSLDLHPKIQSVLSRYRRKGIF